MNLAFKKINIFRERLQIAVNFFDIFNEEFEPISLETPLDFSRCFLPLISSPKNLIQKSNIPLSLINNLLISKERHGFTINSKDRIMRNILKSYFQKKIDEKPQAKRQSIVKYCYEFLCDIGNLHNLKFLESFSFSNFEENLQYKTLDEETLHLYMDKLYLLDKQTFENLKPEDIEFLLSFFSEIFLLNFTIALTFLLMNMMFFIVCFNDSILKKVHMSNREDPELSIIELLDCQELNILKDFALEFLQNKDSNYYNFEVFSKFHEEFLTVVRNVYYLEEYAKILLYSKINLGYEKINIILAIALNIACLEELDAGYMASILKRVEEIVHTAFDFMDFNLMKIGENLVFCLYEMLFFNFNFNYQEPSKKHLELIHLLEKNYLNLFESSIKDCETLLRNFNSFRVHNRDHLEMKDSVAKKLKIYFIILQNSSFYEFVEKSLDLIHYISMLLCNKAYNLPYYKTFIELCSK